MSESLRPGLEVLQTAARATALVEEAARAHMVGFIRSKACEDGGFAGRTANSDLYYTHFALASLVALYSAPDDTDAVSAYLDRLDRQGVDDFVHLHALLRARLLMRLLDLPRLVRRGVLRGSILGRTLLAAASDKVLARHSGIERLEAWRSRDQGYHHTRKDAPHGTAYAAFLALQIRLDYGLETAAPEEILESIRALVTDDGGVANAPGIEHGTTTATGAAVMLRHYLGAAQDAAMLDWLMRQAEPSGGFRAGAAAPVADLLSTSVALLALRTAGWPLDDIRESCLDFIDTMWQDEGGFCGSIADPITDVEYTFYGLLALGCLARQER